jgi:hypothetical protein
MRIHFILVAAAAAVVSACTAAGPTSPPGPAGTVLTIGPIEANVSMSSATSCVLSAGSQNAERCQ